MSLSLAACLMVLRVPALLRFAVRTGFARPGRADAPDVSASPLRARAKSS
jgi:hypothetical protein